MRTFSKGILQGSTCTKVRIHIYRPILHDVVLGQVTASPAGQHGVRRLWVGHGVGRGAWGVGQTVEELWSLLAWIDRLQTAQIQSGPAAGGPLFMSDTRPAPSASLRRAAQWQVGIRLIQSSASRG